MIKFTDSHCHIHDPEFFPDDSGEKACDEAVSKGIHRMFCIGTDAKSSAAAIDFASRHDNCYATVGIHPHDAKLGVSEFNKIEVLLNDNAKIIAVGEIGLDYHYMNSPREDQLAMLERQIDLALRHDLPIVFHMREGFDDFWPLFDNFSGIKGVLHSYTDNQVNLEKGLDRGLFVGVNGIATFSQEVSDVVKQIPLDRLLLETDAPFLTPKPVRGTMNVPGNVGHVASYMTELLSISLEELSDKTEQNLHRLFFTGKSL